MSTQKKSKLPCRIVVAINERPLDTCQRKSCGRVISGEGQEGGEGAQGHERLERGWAGPPPIREAWKHWGAEGVE